MRQLTKSQIQLSVAEVPGDWASLRVVKPEMERGGGSRSISQGGWQELGKGQGRGKVLFGEQSILPGQTVHARAGSKPLFPRWYVGSPGNSCLPGSLPV